MGWRKDFCSTFWKCRCVFEFYTSQPLHHCVPWTGGDELNLVHLPDVSRSAWFAFVIWSAVMEDNSYLHITDVSSEWRFITIIYLFQLSENGTWWVLKDISIKWRFQSCILISGGGAAPLSTSRLQTVKVSKY